MENIGFIICEAAPTTVEASIIGERNNRVIIETVLQDANVKNRNGRFYADTQLFPQLKAERTIELLESGNLKGENGHPSEQNLARQSTIDPMKVCVKYLKLWTEGNLIKAHAVGTQNDLGRDFNNDILDGEKPSFSLRALGTVKNTARGAEVENIKIITWDRVYYPSHKKAYMQNVVKESTNLSMADKKSYIMNEKGLVIPIDTQSVVDYIKEESANIKTIKESFDTLFDTIDLVENGRRVRMSNGQGQTIIVNLESYIQDVLMDYANRY